MTEFSAASSNMNGSTAQSCVSSALVPIPISCVGNSIAYLGVLVLRQRSATSAGSVLYLVCEFWLATGSVVDQFLPLPGFCTSFMGGNPAMVAVLGCDDCSSSVHCVASYCSNEKIFIYRVIPTRRKSKDIEAHTDLVK